MWTTGDAGSAALALSLSYPTPSSIVVPAGAAAVVLAAGAVAGVVCAVRCCGRCGSACGVWTTADAGTAALFLYNPNESKPKAIESK